MPQTGQGPTGSPIYILPKGIEKQLNYLRKDTADATYAKIESLTNYITKQEAESLGSIGPDTLKKYVLRSDLNNLVNSSLDSIDLVSKIDTTKLGKVIVIPNMVNEQKALEIANKAIKDANIQVDLTNYYNKAEVDSKITEKTNTILESKEYVSNTELIEALKTVDVKESTKNSIINAAILKSNQAMDNKLQDYGTKAYIGAEITRKITEANQGQINLDGYATEEFVNNKIGELVIPDVSGFANKTDVYTKDQVLTKRETYTREQANGVFVKNVDAENTFAKKTELTEKIEEVNNTITSKHQELNNKIISLSIPDAYSKQESDNKYQTKENTESTYLKKSELPDMDLYYKKAETEVRYALKTNTYNKETIDNKFIEKSTVENDYVKRLDLSNLVNAYTRDQADIKFFTIEESKKYVKKNEISALVDGYSKSEANDKFLDKTTANDTYLKKSDTVIVDAYTKQQSDEKYSLKTDTTSNTGKIAKVENFLDGYLTTDKKLSAVIAEVQSGGAVDLTNYYTKVQCDDKFALKTDLQNIQLDNYTPITDHNQLKNTVDGIKGTVDGLPSNYAPKGEFDTLKSTVETLQTKEAYSKVESDGKYALKDASYSKSDSDNKYAVRDSVDSSISGINNKLTKVDTFLGTYITNEPIKNLSTVIQEVKTDIGTITNLENYYNKTDSDGKFVTKETYNGKIGEIDTTLQSLNTTYASKAIEDIVNTLNSKEVYTKQESDDKFALKSSIPSVTMDPNNYYDKSTTDGKFNTIETFNQKVEEINTSLQGKLNISDIGQHLTGATEPAVKAVLTSGKLGLEVVVDDESEIKFATKQDVTESIDTKFDTYKREINQKVNEKLATVVNPTLDFSITEYPKTTEMQTYVQEKIREGLLGVNNVSVDAPDTLDLTKYYTKKQVDDIITTIQKTKLDFLDAESKFLPRNRFMEAIHEYDIELLVSENLFKDKAEKKDLDKIKNKVTNIEKNLSNIVISGTPIDSTSGYVGTPEVYYGKGSGLYCELIDISLLNAGNLSASDTHVLLETRVVKTTDEAHKRIIQEFRYVKDNNIHVARRMDNGSSWTAWVES